jgi:poly(A) polymerase
MKYPQKISINEKLLLQIGEFADSLGVEVYVVGGYVRDKLLSRSKTDFDCTVVGDSIDFAKKIAKHFNSKAIIFENFRTAMVPVGGFQLEFVGTRKEIYESKSRKPIVSDGTLEDDIRRRDFTVNAMAVSINSKSSGEIIDLFGGLQDLEDKILRTPLDPEITYSDDPLRMMRAARFASQLGFRIEEKSFDSIANMVDRISIVSAERISDEFLKILSSDKPSIGLYVLQNTGLMKIIFPEVSALAGTDIVQVGDKVHAHKDVFHHTLKVVDNIALMTDNVWLRFAALMHDIAKPRTKKYIEGIGWSFYGHEEIGARMQKKIFSRMKLPIDKMQYVEKLVRLHQRPMMLVEKGITDSAIRRLAVTADEALEDLFTLCRADITTKNPNKSAQYYENYNVVFQKVLDVQEKDRLRAFQSPVNGEEIMLHCNIQPSKLVGIIKTNIEEAILEGIIPNEYQAAFDYFIANKDLWLSENSENVKTYPKKIVEKN